MADGSPHISALIPQDDDPNQIAVEVDGAPMTVVSVAIVDDLRLGVGLPMTDELRGAIEEAAAIADARRIGFDLLGTRPYSSGEIADRLARRSFGPSVVAAAVESLLDDGWLDDHAYGVRVAEDILAKDAAGPAKLEEALRKRKLDDATIAAVLTDVLDEIDASASAMEAARKKLRAMGDVPPPTALRRIGGYLGRRGIDADVIEDVLRELADEMGVVE